LGWRERPHYVTSLCQLGQQLTDHAVGNAIGYGEHRSRSHDAVIRVYDEAGNVIETHEHAGDFREP
jgi:hypothetical protein